jgi:hypothetical protein
MKHFIILLLTLILTGHLSAQVSEYDWDEKPSFEVNEEETKGYSAVVLLDYRIKSLTGDDEYTRPYLLSSKHVAIKILDKKAIEDYNQVFVPSNGTIDEIKARTIKPDGTIIEVNKDNIKEVKNKKYGNVTIFAIEGVDEGDILEYIYKVESDVDYCGMEIFQRDIPVQKAVFELHYTSLYNVKTKVYSGFPEIKESSTSYKLYATAKKIPALPDENVAMNNHSMRVVYHVESVNLSNRKLDVVTWERVAANYRAFNEVKRIKGASKLFKQLGFKTEISNEEKINRLEKYIKENFTYKRRSAKTDKLKNILKNKYGNEQDFTIVMKYLLKKIGINSIWMISSDKEYLKIDPDFANYHLLSEHLLYIPSTGKYLSMGYKNLRHGPPPAYVLNNHALVIDNVVGETRKIKYDVAEYTKQEIEAEVDFTKLFSKTFVNKKMSFSGYRSSRIRSALNSSSEETRKSISKEFMTELMGEAIITNEKVDNEKFDAAFKNAPVSVSARIETSDLIEDADDIVIFSLGKLIGKQGELYEETEREMPIELTYPIIYNSKIIVNIPEGYIVSGIEDCIIKNEYKDDGEVLAQFNSTAKIEDGKIIINLEEYYKSFTYKVEKYDAYRSVLNSAADFNKLVLVFEKEE